MTIKERVIVERLAYLQREGIDSLTLDQLADYMYADQDGALLARPEHWRSALNSTMRNLGSKVERRGCRLRRTTRLGRGNKGEFEFKGNFAKFLLQKEAVLA